MDRNLSDLTASGALTSLKQTPWARNPEFTGPSSVSYETEPLVPRSGADEPSSDRPDPPPSEGLFDEDRSASAVSVFPLRETAPVRVSRREKLNNPTVV